MTPAILTLAAGAAARRVDLFSYLTSEAEDAAAAAAHAWIKGLRHASVDGQPLRRRFTYRGDSLWWFAELYLHKQQVVLDMFRTFAALDALIRREQPASLSVHEGDRVVRTIVPELARARGVGCRDATPRRASRAWLAVMDTRAGWLHASALASRLRGRTAPRRLQPAAVLAFVHRAFWRRTLEDASAEQYIGPVLSALEARLPPGGLQYVSVGPPANFRARRWWHPVVGGTGVQHAPPVEAFASLASLRPSRRLWRTRHAARRALWASADLRAAATIRGCDCWPLVREQLAGIALLQWPWSARAMDEAGAALDALAPSVALTYAEAGGWGRALVLECRRRAIPTAGLQHGFIYRHWLNYLHEPDEMAPDQEQPGDAGFPRPSVTLLFDAYAAQHLAQAGRFPPEALRITGSPRLDDLVRIARSLSDDDLAKVRADAGAGVADALVLVTTKWKEARPVLAGLLRSLTRVPGVHVGVKTHPAETPEVYQEAARGLARVRILPAAAPLAPLLAASRAVVTVNSTVALDAAVLGVPALVAGRASNLSPFVEAGLMVGVGEGDGGDALARILYDQGFRQQFDAVRQAFLARFEIQSDGRAAERTASAVLQLAEGVGQGAAR